MSIRVENRWFRLPCATSGIITAYRDVAYVLIGNPNRDRAPRSWLAYSAKIVTIISNKYGKKRNMANPVHARKVVPEVVGWGKKMLSPLS